ncbi:ATP diphosphatase [Sphingomonas gellani]|uniref:ATP diphosphatase n=1 Tax=Sphingomonas gellani TaxID=1166340 RepID=A0A1H7ZSP0_9SPHN|nr:nucleoside triphosphate pyrophosphohydrolase [Sphingomonas gellani]SEM60397.1 ATP diphosphatase [Sphingomonas gellani]
MIDRLTDIMIRLRGPDGCAWDRAQDWSSIAPYTIEEAYEVADAIARDNPDDLKEELGDLLLQVVFHSRIAEERGAFDMAAVIGAICDKLEHRHPHIFGTADAPVSWEAIKAEERGQRGDPSALAGVALGLPELLRAEKLQKRAARTGFDWPDPDGARDKILEELSEVQEADVQDREDEIGDLLFSVVNYARHLGVDAEAALRRANGKFERRFRHMETAAAGGFASLDLDNKELLWKAAKLYESKGAAPDDQP